MPITLFDTSSQKPIYYESGSEAKDAILSGQANFDPAQEVFLKDPSGEIVKTTGKDALNYVVSPESEYSLASDEDVRKINRAKKFGTPGQQALTAVEGAVNATGLGFGKAMAKTAVDLFTPRGSDYAKKYGEAVKEREEENPMADLTGEVGGTLLDPLNAYHAISEGAERVAAKGVGQAAQIASKTSPIVEKIATAPIVQKVATRAAQFGMEGAGYAGANETGRQLVDDKPINSDAIIAHMKDGAVLGAGIGAVVGGLEHTGSKALRLVKEKTKNYLDKITNAGPENSGEIFSDVSTNALPKEVPPGMGRSQKAIKLEDQGEGIFKYSDDRKEGVFKKIKANAKGLDLGDPEHLDEVGKNIGIDDLSGKIKIKSEDEPLEDFLLRTRKNQFVEDTVKGHYPYMDEADQRIADQVNRTREAFGNLSSVTDDDVKIMETALKKERKLFEKYEIGEMPKRTMKGFDGKGAPIWDDSDINQFKSARDAINGELDDQVKTEVHRAMSDYDYIKNGKDVYVFNESILPESVTVKNLGKGITPLDFEAKMIAKQYRMTPQQMIKKGNERLNEVAQFILDQYPKQGSMLSRATTSADVIAENINTVKQKAINEMNEAVEAALNMGGSRNSLTTKDIADYVESHILPRYTDEVSGNPLAGLKKEYDQIKSFADEYRQNGFVTDKYGRRVYKPIDVKELRSLRQKLDDVANYNKSAESASALEDAARDLRGWVEDHVVSRVKSVDPQLVEKYNAAKKNYWLSKDAGKIVDAATMKAAKDSHFSLFYSGVGAGVGASVAGVPGAIVGGLVGGAARQTLREFSGALSIFLADNLGKNVDRYEKLVESTAKAFFRPMEKSVKTYLILPRDSDKEVAATDYARLVSELSDRQDYAEKFVEHNEDLFNAFPQTSQKILDTTMRARDFLISKIPQNPYTGNPWKEKTWAPSPVEMNKYMRYREAVNNPATILRQIKDGYVTPEAIEVLDSVYPDTKQTLMMKFAEHAEKAKELPIEKRVELFKIFGIKLDSFMSGEEFNELQANSNAQAAKKDQGQNFKPGNVFKTNIGKKDSTVGNSTLK